MRESPRALVVTVFAWFLFCNGFLTVMGENYNYKEALTKCLLFLEAQRSGRLVRSRIPWRGDSAMEDGKLANVSRLISLIH